MMKWSLMAVFVALSGFAIPAKAKSQEAQVTVSIKPIHSLVTGVMEGAGIPHLLVKGNRSPHTYHLKPSDARALQRAKLIVWVGRNMEGALEGPIKTLGRNAMTVELIKTPGIAHLNTQNAKHNHQSNDPDPHLWLDPQNAKLFVKEIVTALGEADPVNAVTYKANGTKLLARLDNLTAHMKEELAQVKDRPFVVFHDAYQYLENAFGLNVVGSVTVSPDKRPGAKRVKQIRDKIKKLGALCIFSEPQFEPKLVKVIAEGTKARSGVLDPLGSDLDDGPDLYFNLMKRNTKALKDCLSKSNEFH